METLERYDALLDARAAQERLQAQQAELRGDEREQSVHLMLASLLEGMLKRLGRAQHTKAKPDALAQKIERFGAEAEAALEAQDFDAQDRARTKAAAAQWALDRLRETEANEDE